MSSNEKKEAIPDGMGKALCGLIEKIKGSPNYTKEIGLQLGIEVPADGEDTTRWKEFPGTPDYRAFRKRRSRQYGRRWPVVELGHWIPCCKPRVGLVIC